MYVCRLCMYVCMYMTGYVIILEQRLLRLESVIRAIFWLIDCDECAPLFSIILITFYDCCFRQLLAWCTFRFTRPCIALRNSTENIPKIRACTLPIIMIYQFVVTLRHVISCRITSNRKEIHTSSTLQWETERVTRINIAWIMVDTYHAQMERPATVILIIGCFEREVAEAGWAS